MDQFSRQPGAPARGEGGTVERVLRHLREGVTQRRFAPGQRLVEADLTRDLGVSRGPLREAFRRLAAEGLIDLVPNRGATVRRLDSREVAELFEIRAELEALGARRAAERIADPAVRAAFECAVRPIWTDGPRQPGPYTDENQSFHLAVIRASGSAQLDAITRHLQLPLILLQVRREPGPEDLARSVAEHRAIAGAILAGDPAAADRAMRAHLARAADLAAADAPGAAAD